MDGLIRADWLFSFHWPQLEGIISYVISYVLLSFSDCEIEY